MLVTKQLPDNFHDLYEVPIAHRIDEKMPITWTKTFQNKRVIDFRPYENDHQISQITAVYVKLQRLYYIAYNDRDRTNIERIIK